MFLNLVCLAAPLGQQCQYLVSLLDSKISKNVNKSANWWPPDTILWHPCVPRHPGWEPLPHTNHMGVKVRYMTNYFFIWVNFLLLLSQQLLLHLQRHQRLPRRCRLLMTTLTSVDVRRQKCQKTSKFKNVSDCRRSCTRCTTCYNRSAKTTKKIHQGIAKTA